MGAAKWIGGIIGFMAGGPLGALAGFVFGSLFDTQFPLLHARDGFVHYPCRRAHHA